MAHAMRRMEERMAAAEEDSLNLHNALRVVGKALADIDGYTVYVASGDMSSKKGLTEFLEGLQESLRPLMQIGSGPLRDGVQLHLSSTRPVLGRGELYIDGRSVGTVGVSFRELLEREGEGDEGVIPDDEYPAIGDYDDVGNRPFSGPTRTQRRTR